MCSGSCPSQEFHVPNSAWPTPTILKWAHRWVLVTGFGKLGGTFKVTLSNYSFLNPVNHTKGPWSHTWNLKGCPYRLLKKTYSVLGPIPAIFKHAKIPSEHSKNCSVFTGWLNLHFLVTRPPPPGQPSLEKKWESPRSLVRGTRVYLMAICVLPQTACSRRQGHFSFLHSSCPSVNHKATACTLLDCTLDPSSKWWQVPL